MPQPPTRTALYRLYNADNLLLYVGISKHPEQRYVEHRQIKFWWHQVARKVVSWYDSREQAEDAETEAILTEHPRHDRTWRMSGSAARKHGIERVVEHDPEVGRVDAGLRKAIETGQYQVGDRLPGYRDIEELFGVSIPTARAAVLGLIRDGMVCNLSRSAGYPVTVVQESPTGRPARREDFLHLASKVKRATRPRNTDRTDSSGQIVTG